MALPQISLAVVGADFPNKRGPARRFELAICRPGEALEFLPEPDNPKDELAVAVYSCRGVQIGYLTAERCGRIGAFIRQGREVRAIFQEHTRYGGVARAAFDGDEPTLPERVVESTDEPDWWPDEEWPE